MKKQNNQAKFQLCTLIAACFMVLFSFTSLQAQYADGNYLYENGNTYYLDADYKTLGQDYLDLKIPNNPSYQYLALTIKGADGGNAKYSNEATSGTTKNAGGGVGATIDVYFEIGNNASQLRPNSTLRFIVGKAGKSTDYAGGGGGGTGVLYKEYGTANWEVLAVAGGGGGGVLYRNTWNTTYERVGSAGGTDYDVASPSGTSTKNGGGGAYDESGYLGGRTGYAGMASRSNPTGGNGGTGTGTSKHKGGDGGFGFGGGGGGAYGTSSTEVFGYGGGGGGYDGGASGSYRYGGKGGTSFVISSGAVNEIRSDKTTKTPQDGFVAYSFSNNNTSRLYKYIKSVASSDKCMDVKNSQTTDEANVQLYSCNNSNAQKWYYFKNSQEVRLAALPSMCLDLKSGNASNGANIQLYHCNETTAQQWIYDSSSRLKLTKETSKCITLKSGATSNGTNISLYNCNSNNTEKWTFN